MDEEEKQRRFSEGLRLFNSGQFYESHEEWELIWHKAPQQDRNFYQGLILYAAFFVHLSKGRIQPALKAMAKAVNRLGPYGKSHLGIELAELCEDGEQLAFRLSMNEHFRPDEFPEIIWIQ